MRPSYEYAYYNQHFYEVLDFNCSSEEEAFYEFFELDEKFIELHASQDFTQNVSGLVHGDVVHRNNIITENYFTLLNKGIRIRPGLYLYKGGKSLKYLKHFIDGYTYCAKALKLPFDPHPGFDDFIRKKYNTASQKSIYDIIEFYELKGDVFDSFFKYMDEFRKNHYVYKMRP